MRISWIYMINKLFVFVLAISIISCKAYKQDILFKLDENDPSLQQAINTAEKNYVIQRDDILQVDVFTNEGERIIDPNFELQQLNAQNQIRREFTYLVQQDGFVKLPIVGRAQVDGFTLDDAESKLETLFDEFYKDSFVKLAFTNKRVILLGATGGQIIPLENQNMSLVEVLALAGGIDFGARAHNIRVIRGDLENPTVFQIDLNTIKGMKESILPIEPGDVIYVEPWRRPWLESVKDVTPALTAVTSLIAFILLLSNI